MCLNLMEKEWDVAVVLDACRYDYFKDIHREYLPEGKLTKEQSASYTQEYLRRAFPKPKYDLTCIGGHPALNSAGIPWGGFYASKKFTKVVDAWALGWDEERGTTNPREVTNLAWAHTGRGQDKKVLIHYMQPHFPYLNAPFKAPPYKKHGWVGKQMRKAPNFIREGYWRARYLLNLPDPPTRYYLENYTPDEIRKHYAENVHWVLKEVGRLFTQIKDKRVVVTADHAELLGENGEWFHPMWVRHPILNTVPFYEVSL